MARVWPHGRSQDSGPLSTPVVFPATTRTCSPITPIPGPLLSAGTEERGHAQQGCPAVAADRHSPRALRTQDLGTFSSVGAGGG